jgi:hypothetical protein
VEPRWFLLAHYFDPHFSYEPKPGFEHLNELYDVEISYADHHLGRLLEAVARAPGRTLVVFSADHGESFGEHDLYFHGRSVYDPGLRVPRVVALPGVARAGHRVATPVSHVDLMPSLLELLGIAAPPGLAGRSLVSAIQGGDVAARPIYGESLVHWFEVDDGVQIHALVDGRYKWIERQETLGDSGEVRTRRELYDLEADPGERVNLARLHGERAERMQTALLDSHPAGAGGIVARAARPRRGAPRKAPCARLPRGARIGAVSGQAHASELPLSPLPTPSAPLSCLREGRNRAAGNPSRLESFRCVRAREIDSVSPPGDWSSDGPTRDPLIRIGGDITWATISIRRHYSR